MTRNLLAVNIAGLTLPNPTVLASGILGYTGDSLRMVEEKGAGAVVTKSIGVEPRMGYPNPTVVQARGSLINAVGLPNPGIDDYTEELQYAKNVLEIPLVVSVFGYTSEEYALVAKKATEAGADAVELNVSCPHVQHTGSEIGQNPKLLGDVIRSVKAAVKKPVIVKLSPNVTDIVELAKNAEKAGADALTLINTVRAMAIDVEAQMPILSNVRGGLSGPAIKPIALRCLFDAFEAVKLPLVGCGGVSDWRDAVEFFLAGARAVQIGSAVALEDPSVFQSINRGLTSYLRKKGYRSVNEIVGLAHQA